MPPFKGHAYTLGFSRQHVSLAGERSTRVFLVHLAFLRLSRFSPFSLFHPRLSHSHAFRAGFIPAPKGGMNYSGGGENV
jgi:hypothetical protein